MNKDKDKEETTVFVAASIITVLAALLSVGVTVFLGYLAYLLVNWVVSH